MRKINAEKELDKINKGNKNKIIIGICTLLVIIAIGSTYALYQVRHSNKLVYNNVDSFKKRDIYLSVLVDGKTEDNFPNKNSGIVYTGIECDKEYQEAYFDNTEWEFHFSSKGPNKCTIKFETGNLPNTPELYQGMIPIVYGNNGLMYVADLNTDWYNYQDHRWANAVLVDASNTTIKNKYFKEDNTLRDDIAGIQVPMEEVLQMYVWIPRYKYQLWNVDNEGKPKQIINIKFEKGTDNTGDIVCKYSNNGDITINEECTNKNTNEKVQNGDWYTHPAFTFKGTLDESGTELKGIWVGKFEASNPADETGRKSGIQEITILPNKTTSVNLGGMKGIFNVVQKIEEVNNKYNLKPEEVDSHPIKNSEWGAMAYLTYSAYGIFKPDNTCNIEGMNFEECRIWINNIAQGTGHSDTAYQYGGTATGCVGLTFDAAVEWSDGLGPAVCPEGRRWNESGIKASTTGNMYGIYDTNGGTFELAMSAYLLPDGSPLLPGFDTSAYLLYFDLYTTARGDGSIETSHLGDAIREVKNVNDYRAWNKMGIAALRMAVGYDDYAGCYRRGGDYETTNVAGIFSSGTELFGNTWYTTFRAALTAQYIS